MTSAVQASCSPEHHLVLGGHSTINLLSQGRLSRAGPGKQGPSRQGQACHSPAAVLSLPTGVLEQLRSMVDDSEEAAPGLQPV